MVHLVASPAIFGKYHLFIKRLRTGGFWLSSGPWVHHVFFGFLGFWGISCWIKFSVSNLQVSFIWYCHSHVGYFFQPVFRGLKIQFIQRFIQFFFPNHLIQRLPVTPGRSVGEGQTKWCLHIFLFIFDLMNMFKRRDTAVRQQVRFKH